jgi:hypothetical protein
MQRRHFLFLAPLLPSALLAPRLLRGQIHQNPPTHNVRDTALRIDELASNIHTPADARQLIDFIAELFADTLPPAWTTNFLRSRLAEGEYLSVTTPQKLVPEKHLAQVWNTYVTTIHAPDESKVSAAEIHNLRDALYSIAHITWSRGYRNFWAVPSIFATQHDGTLAPSCRIVESLRILYDLVRFPQNLRAAREAVAKGILTSELMKQSQQKPSSSSPGRAYVSAGIGEKNYVEDAAMQYIREHGMAAFSNIIETMLDTVLSS